MAQKVVGYREMLWTCPNCGAKNPGSSRVCKSCGASMGEEVKFEQQTAAGMIKDEKIIEQAAKGPDIYCAYCGNRNPAGAAKCSRCGADLSEGKEREHGTEHVAHLDEKPTPEQLICPACGAANPAGTLRCKNCGTPLNVSSQVEEITAPAQPPVQNKGCGRGCIFIILALVLFGIMILLFMGGGIGMLGGIGLPQNTPVPNSIVYAVVTEQNWQTSIQVIGPVDSRASGWEKDMPSDARNKRCQDKLYATYKDEVRGSVEVCGTPYAIDMGNGYEKFVQDCVYEVYEPYCEYTISKPGVIETRRANGSGPNPEMPFVESRYDIGNQSASYSVKLTDENGQVYSLNPSNITDYRSFSVGSEYIIEVTGSGRIVNMERQ